MVSLKYIDSDFKTFCCIGDGYIRTLKDIRDWYKLQNEIAQIYVNARMWEEAGEHITYAEQLRELFYSLIDGSEL